jgi:putative restriction endonuclease
VRAWVAVTDKDWYRFLHQRPDLDEVNFWQPGGHRAFRTLSPGEPFLFKLHYPDNAVVGGGFLTYSSRLLPAKVAWDAFGEKNGAPSYEEMCRRIERYRRAPLDPRGQYTIGCIILQDPFFWAEGDWLPAPADFRPQTVQGKAYDLREGIGRELWEQVLARIRAARGSIVAEPPSEIPLDWRDRPVRLRLGQGAFRVLVTDVYERRCAVTGEKALPVLQAAHIRPVTKDGPHRVDNGLLLRSDVHALFDQGYVTVTPDRYFRVSQRLKRDFDNGEAYYPFSGNTIWLPGRTEDHPSREFLEWHADTVYRG